MPDAVLVFTFGPIQPFIAEARRASDLYAGSQTLVALARAAAQELAARGTLVYPTGIGAAGAGRDVPNKLVAVLPWEQAQAAAQAAERALWAKWRELSEQARRRFEREAGVPVDDTWRAIWQRQTGAAAGASEVGPAGSPWEVYWAAARYEPPAYAAAYEAASRGLDAAKRTRAFAAAEEDGEKDSLSGRRAALHATDLPARKYWKRVGERVSPSLLRPGGDERLDALGVCKRFSPLLDHARFPSTSTVASADFLARAKRDAPDALRAYRQALEALLGSRLYRPRADDRDWPYDGDLLFAETLTPERLRDSYGVKPQELEPRALRAAQEALRRLHGVAGGAPSPYYAVVVLDGDSMGERLGACLDSSDPLGAHQELSRRLAAFSDWVQQRMQSAQGALVYNGGDDVLLLAPLAEALPLAAELAAAFHEQTATPATQGTASAGIAVVHHLYPLDAALRAAREAEARAKQVAGKAAVGVAVLRRSGERRELVSPWAALKELNGFDALVALFRDGGAGPLLAGRFPYEVADAARALPAANDLFAAELRRLLARHHNQRHPERLTDARRAQWAAQLNDWAASLASAVDGTNSGMTGTALVADWLVFARFVAQGGGER
jgi:CRISPR-associated protein Cmr2